MSFLTSPWCFNSIASSLLLLSLNAHADFADISRIFHQTPQLAHFEVCQGGGCAQVSSTQLSPEEWQQVSALFKPAPSTPEQEREKIAQAIGLLEQIVGKKIGTNTDLAGTFDSNGTPGQMDCNDEAINSTTYMRLMKQAGYIKFHEIEDTRTRNFFFTGWPHSTAVIHELTSQQRYAVDSWFYDNGHAATIITFEQWKDNFYPADSPVGKPRKQAKNPQ